MVKANFENLLYSISGISVQGELSGSGQVLTSQAISSLEEQVRLRVLSSAFDDDAWTQMTEQLIRMGLYGSLRVA